MLKYMEFTAKTEDEAIAKGLTHLGLDRDDVSVEILERGKTGFLGIGSVPAKVKLTYEAPDEPAPEADFVLAEMDLGKVLDILTHGRDGTWQAAIR